MWDAIVAFADVVRPISIIIGFIVTIVGIPGAIVGAVVAVRRTRKWMTTQDRKSTTAVENSKEARVAAQSADHKMGETAKALTATSEVLSDTNEQMARALRENEVLREKYDHLWGEYLRANTIEGRMRLLERWAEEQETTVHQLTRALSTTGANHAEQ